MAGKYESHVYPYLDVVSAWARDGMIDEEIAKQLHIAYSTFRLYKKKYPELAEVLRTNKEIVDRRVENALLKRAFGYKYTEITKERILDVDEGDYVLKITKEVDKEVSPDVSAIMSWLKNRDPERWKDKQEIEHSGQLDVGEDTLEAMLGALGYEKK